jgi:hypothetical protein
MVNPTGYTALDLIGFTDKGTYLSSENYVKNDLVHYGGNIWRCLIDDTSRVEPAEGVNWTLFIEEPTNLVERIIAPVETNPATNAYAVGKQLIFNGLLCKATSAIAVGDTLAVGTNLALSDNVVEQIYSLNQGLTNSLANISHENLLDNPWFTVNQRGASSYVGEAIAKQYTFDRWLFSYVGNTKSVTKNNDGTITFASTSEETNQQISQLFESIPSDCDMTLSIDVVNYTGNDIQVFLGLDVSPYTSFLSLTINKTGINSVTARVPDLSSYNPINIKVSIKIDGNNSVTFKSIKLEKGTVSTLAMDSAPNYATELLKCQRYYVDMGGIQVIFASSEQGARVFSSPIRWPVNMRTNPSINIYEENSYVAIIQNVKAYNLTQFGSTFEFGNITKQGCYCVRKANVSDTDMLGKQLGIIHLVASADL